MFVKYSQDFPLTYLVTGGLTLFHQTGVVRAIPARPCRWVDMETRERYGSDSSLSKSSGPFATFLNPPGLGVRPPFFNDFWRILFVQ